MLKLALTDIEKKWFKATKKRLELKQILRYDNYQPMYYRVDVYRHCIRVALLVKELAERVKRVCPLDKHKVFLMALIHDDPEIIIGDFSAGEKAKMSEGQLRKIKEAEKAAEETLIELFPKKLGKYHYRKLLEEVSEKQSLEARMVDIADKLDATGECFHEIFAGNEVFVTPIISAFGELDAPVEHQWKFSQGIAKRHPPLAFLLQTHLSFLPLPRKNWRAIAKDGKPHTMKSLKKPTGLEAYDFWGQTLLKRDPERQLKLLTDKIE